MVKLNDEKTLNRWSKFAETILLMAMGLMFFIIAWISDEDLGNGLSYAVGTVCAVYGIILIGTEYLVKRKPITNKSIAGVVFVGLSVALFVNPEAINSLLSEMLSTITFVIAALLIIYASDLLFRNHKMQIQIDNESAKEDNIDLNMIAKTKTAKKKNVNTIIFCFALAAVLITGGVLFEYYFYAVGIKTIDQYLLMIYGVGVFVYALILFLGYYRNNKEIKQAMIDEENRKKEELNRANVVKEDTVKVINLSDLQKERRRRKAAENNASSARKAKANERGEISIEDLASYEENETEKNVSKKKSSSKKTSSKNK